MRRLSVLGGALLVVATASAPAIAPAAAQPRSAAHPAPRAAAKAAKAAKATKLAAVSGLRAYDAGSRYPLTWHNPPQPSFDRVVVRYAKGSTAPPSPHRGTGAHLATRTATTVTLTHLARNARYSVSVWARDAHHHYAKPETVRFTTEAKTAAEATVRGQVLDAAGAPLAGVVVTAYAENGAPVVLSATTGADGSYTLTGPRGEYFAHLDGSSATGGDSDATGYVADDLELTIRHPARSGPVTRLESGGAITGSVTDRSGAALAGVTVGGIGVQPYVAGDSGLLSYFDDPSVAVSAHDGTFALKGVPANALTLCYSTDNGAVTGGANDSYGYADTCSSVPISVPARQVHHVAAQELARGAGATISGTVTAAGTGDRVGMAVITVSPAGTDNEVAAAQADATGAYSVAGLSPGNYTVCADGSTAGENTPTGYAPGCAATAVSAALGTPATADVRLGAGAAFTGTVRGPKGQRLADVGVDVLDSAQDEDAGAQTDAEGHYTVKSLRAAAVQVCFDATSATGHDLPTGASSGCYRHSAKVSVRIGTVRTGIDGALGAAGAVTGTLHDSAGHPFADAEVQAFSSKQDEGYGGDYLATTDAHGHYRLTGLTGTVHVCFSEIDASDTYVFLGFDGDSGVSSCHRTAVTVRAGHTTKHVDATLARNGVLRVHVDDTHSHALSGVEAVALQACTNGGDGDGDCTSAPVFSSSQPVDVAAGDITDPDGDADLFVPSSGHYAVCLLGYYAVTPALAVSQGYVDTCTSHTFDIKTGAATIAATLAAAGAVSGQVTDADGHPLAGVVVNVTNSAATSVDNSDGFAVEGDGSGPSGPTGDNVTGSDGTYTVRSVAPGHQTVCFDASQERGGTDTNGYYDQCYGGTVGSTSGGTPVTVTAGQTTTVASVALTGESG